MYNDLSNNEIRRLYQKLQENLKDNRSKIESKHKLEFMHF